VWSPGKGEIITTHFSIYGVKRDVEEVALAGEKRGGGTRWGGKRKEATDSMKKKLMRLSVLVSWEKMSKVEEESYCRPAFEEEKKPL